MLTLDIALRACEILLALAFLQQSAEHIFGRHGHWKLFAPRAGLALLLLCGLYSEWVILVLCAHSLLILHRFQGPYNGGSDKMGLLILYCICLAHWLPDGLWSEAAFGYLSAQVVLSYFVSGQVKIMNPEWRSGRALQDVFAFSAYPVSAHLRGLADKPRLLFGASWAVIVFEVMFPLSLLNSTALVLALAVAASFHLANAFLFGLNRFVWFWIASYPSVLWLQNRLLSVG